jgi:hypothetical protein
MGQKRIFRTLEYSARVIRLDARRRREVATDLTAVPDRTWREVARDYIIIIGLVDGRSGLPTIGTALLGLLAGLLFTQASLGLLMTPVSIGLLVGWVAAGLIYAALWGVVGATAVAQIRARRTLQRAG